MKQPLFDTVLTELKIKCLCHNCDMNRAQKSKFAIGWYFLLLGAAMGNWSALIPIIMISHNINDAVLGGILMSAFAGT